MNIDRGRKIKLLSNPDNIGVEGYEIGNIYEVSDMRVRDNILQIFLKGNIHAYYLDNFTRERVEKEI